MVFDGQEHSRAGANARVPAGLLVGGMVAAFVGVLIGFLTFAETQRDYLAIVTLAFGEIVRAILRLIKPIRRAARGMIGIPNYSTLAWILFFMTLTLYLLKNLIYSPYGRAFIAIRDNEIAADVMGIDTTKYKITSFCIAAFIAGVAGGLYAHVLAFIQPDSFSFTKSSDFLVLMYAGGSGSLTGSIVALLC
jgi:branched-chain amino acid transport system permease protein